ncbi:hypothetical protein TWF281_003178 [Arthrobotrys megalospora]
MDINLKHKRRASQPLVGPGKRLTLTTPPPTSNPEYAAQSVFQGEGVQNSGSGNFSVGRDLIIGANSSDNDQDARCLKDLRATNPHHDKTRILNTKGGLLADSYIWIRDNADFKRWHNDEESRVLWVKGDPGKGKTMLLCGIVEELKQSAPGTESTKNISFFFCQATDARINNATAVLRGLIYLLVEEQPMLISHVRKEYDRAGRKLFEDVNAWYALSEIFANILQDPSLKSTYLVIDALDECTIDLPKLLNFIVDVLKPSASSRAKWIISSRNWPSIQKDLDNATGKVRLCLELNHESISAAVKAYIGYKVEFLAARHKYNNNLRDEVQRYLLSNANDTFLWVSLACQKLYNVTPRKVRGALKEFPPGLDELYSRMMDQVCRSDDAECCKSILAVVSVTCRPIVLEELLSFIDIPGVDPDDDDGSLPELEDIIAECGSFLVLRENTIFFVHQSAKDYLVKHARMKIFPDGCIEKQHRRMLLRSIKVMQKVLRRDVYSLRDPGRSIDEIEPPNPDPLTPILYAFSYWVDHFCGIESSGDGEGLSDVDGFLREHLLHWLEALSLIKEIPDTIIKLSGLLKKISSTTQLFHLVSDAHRFILSSQHIIENTPLQVYSSALVFSPTHSLVRGLFQDQEIGWITTKPVVEANWGACIQTLHINASDVGFVAFSNDERSIAACSTYGVIKIWSIASGACTQTLQTPHNDKSNQLQRFGSETLAFGFLNNGLRVVSRLDYSTIEIWDTARNTRLQYGAEGVKSAALSNDGTRVVTGLEKGAIMIWNITSNTFERRCMDHSSAAVYLIAFSNDDTQITLGSRDGAIRVWDATGETWMQRLKSFTGVGGVSAISFSNSGTQVASAFDIDDNTAKIWDITSGACTQTLDGHTGRVIFIAFSNDDRRIASGSSDRVIKVWDAISGVCLQTLPGHSGWVASLTFSECGTRIASGSDDGTVKIWDTGATHICEQTPDSHSSEVSSVAFSGNGTQIASGSSNGTIKIWDTSGACIQTLYDHTRIVTSIAFSNDGLWMVSASGDKTAKIWDTSDSTYVCVTTLLGHCNAISSVAFSNDNTQIVSGSYGGAAKIWNTSGVCIAEFINNSWIPSIASIALSNDGTWIATGHINNQIKIWHVSGECLNTSKIDGFAERLTFDTTGSHLLCSTRAGDISLRISSSSNTKLNVIIGEPQHHGYRLSADNKWITWNGRNVLRLPQDRAPRHYTTAPNAIAIGCYSGRVLIFKFSPKSPLE